MHQGLTFCLIRGAGGGKEGWEGTETSLILIKKNGQVFLVCKRASFQGPGAWVLSGLPMGALCNAWPLCPYCGGHVGAIRRPVRENIFFWRF